MEYVFRIGYVKTRKRVASGCVDGSQELRGEDQSMCWPRNERRELKRGKRENRVIESGVSRVYEGSTGAVY